MRISHLKFSNLYLLSMKHEQSIVNIIKSNDVDLNEMKKNTNGMI